MNWRNFITVVSVMVLVGTEAFGIAFAGAWAIAGMFELGDIAAYILMALFGLLAIYAMVALWRHSTAIEPIRN